MWLWCRLFITLPHALVLFPLVIITTNIATSWYLGIGATSKMVMNKSKSVCFQSFGMAHEHHKYSLLVMVVPPIYCPLHVPGHVLSTHVHMLSGRDCQIILHLWRSSLCKWGVWVWMLHRCKVCTGYVLYRPVHKWCKDPHCIASPSRWCFLQRNKRKYRYRLRSYPCIHLRCLLVSGRQTNHELMNIIALRKQFTFLQLLDNYALIIM